ncbi:MAG: epoxyqueuosine reductase QueH [Clostridiales bacterium]|nr:epoxyqueuosine reductase QueH [Clostridiales bacterium]
MKKLLLHSCCGPCSSGVLEALTREYDVTILFYNPNIFPEEEYYKRLDTQYKIVNALNSEGADIKIVEVGYNPAEYNNIVQGLENEPEGGSRCEKCFRLRLEKTCKYAKDNGYNIFTTTMSVSPHKNYILLNEIGRDLSSKFGVEYLEANFKKNDGYLKSIRNSEKYDLYRQKYCGCKYSIWDK